MQQPSIINPICILLNSILLSAFKIIVSVSSASVRLPSVYLWELNFVTHCSRMDSDSAPKKSFRSVQKRVVEDIKVEKMTSDASGLGFHNLPFLVHRKSVKKGFEFTLMVVG